MNTIVIGAGLSGAACAHALAQRDEKVQVFSQGGGASELPAGLLAAHLSAQDVQISQLSRAGVSLMLEHAKRLLREGVDWQPCVLEQRLLDEPHKNERLRAAAATLPDWFELRGQDVIHKRAAWVKPQACIKAWLAQPGIKLRDEKVAALRRSGDAWLLLDEQNNTIAKTDALIVAAGIGSEPLLKTAGHALHMSEVRGAVAMGDWPVDATTELINGNGHFMANINRQDGNSFWLSGSTYERGEIAPEAEQIGLLANRERLHSLLAPQTAASIDQQFTQMLVQSWQGIRCSTSDRLPVVGWLESGLYVCTAMGSRALSFAALCAQIAANDMLAADPSPVLSEKLRHVLQPDRKELRIP